MKRILLWTFCLLLLVPLVFLGYTYYEITKETSERINRGAIDQVINSESPVYYSDGQTPIGVFFEKTHSKYINYNDIPKTFIKALVAAEDKDFFHHWGFDPKAIVRAFVANFRSGRVVQGGSTLTQQTAKNVFKREKRSYRTKIHEMFQAFLLEREYTKEEILEMYTNQFFVNGYGKGLRIAAQYFFDKDPHDLDLVEAAFIVGSVKGPNKYNPFIKRTSAEKEKAKHLAKARKDYVLDKMLAQNYISAGEWAAAKERPVPFKEGRITYRLNVILDYVRNQLESDYFQEILQEQGVDNIATSGISIYTSVDQDIQSAALLSLRRHLPRMDVGLTGIAPSKTIFRWKGALKESIKSNNRALPFLARVTKIHKGAKDPGLRIAWENGGAFIGYDGLEPIGEAWLKGKTGPWATFEKDHVSVLLDTIEVGDLVPVQIVTVDSDPAVVALATLAESAPPGEEQVEKLVLSAIAELEGGVVTLHQGMIRAMVGGFSNIHFNRAVDAKRQLGSIFKPIVYASALQLKWNNLDPLKNTKDIYRFEGTTYVPRPDHKPKSDTVSMAWAGAKSENLATVWLLYHLTDRLNMSEFRQVVNLVGLGRKPDEPYQAYKTRIRDQLGIIVDQEALMVAAFEAAKSQAETDIIFSGHENILDHVNRLHFDLSGAGSAIDEDDRSLLRYDFQRLMALKNNTHTNPAVAAALAESAQWVDGLIPPDILELLQTHTQSQFRKLVGHEKYSLEVLSKIRDFRTLVNLSFVTYLSKKIGISTHLDPVLSFPLGPNAISIMEAALAYEALLTGKTCLLGAGGGPAMVPIIKKIVDREGKILWEYESDPKVVLPERVTILTSEILRKVMERGTGRKARDVVRVLDIPLPSFGKTGTANRYTNSSFVGLIPGPDNTTGQLAIENGYTIASYVGFDNNRPMKGDHMALYGSSGALPLWMDTAKAIAKTEDFKQALQPADLAFNPLLRPVTPRKFALHPVPVSPETGLPLKNGEKPSHPSAVPEVLTQTNDGGKTWVLKREFEIFQKGNEAPRMKKTHISLFLILTFSAGCASMPPEPPPPVHTPTEKEGTILNIEVSHVEDRIQFLENFIKNKDLSDSDRNATLALLRAYRLLKKSAPGPVTGKEYDILAQSLYRSMSLMENTYFEKIGTAPVDENSFTDFIQRKNEILDLYLDKNYKGVIQRALALRTSFPGGLTPEIGIIFAISLAEDGMLDEAVEIGMEVAGQIEGTQDVMQLRGDIIGWQLALGQPAQAIKILGEISHTQDDRAAMINDLRNRIQQTPGEPEQPFHSMFQTAEGTAPQEVQPHMASLQERVDALARNHEFAEAKQLLLKEKAEREEGPETEVIDRALNNIEEAETAYEENVMIKETYLKETYEAAGELYEKEDYKGAITTLEALKKTQELSAEAADLKNRAVESLINHERNRAAEIFLQAKKTKDPNKKKELLETSYNILKTLVDDYPQSPLKNKLTSHINIVQREMEKLP